MDSVQIPTSVVPPKTMQPAVASQANSQNQQQAQGKQAEQFEVDKETRMIAELSRQKVAAQPEIQAQRAQQSALERQGSVVETSRKSKTPDHRTATLTSSRAPNWSQLSAAVNGYTHLQRAMNLYQQIDRL